MPNKMGANQKDNIRNTMLHIAERCEPLSRYKQKCGRHSASEDDESLLSDWRRSEKHIGLAKEEERGHALALKYLLHGDQKHGGPTHKKRGALDGGYRTQKNFGMGHPAEFHSAHTGTGRFMHGPDFVLHV
jgi:hypothetical protein